MRREEEREKLDEEARKKKNSKFANKLISDLAFARSETKEFKEHTISKEKEMNIKATQQKQVEQRKA